MNEAKYAKLNENWMLRGWDNIPFAAVNWRSSEVRPFTSRLEFVARACDGQTDFNSLLFLPVHRKIVDKLIEEGIAKECKEDDTPETDQIFRKAANPYLPKIHWSLTGKCNLKCRHCYMEAPGHRYEDLGTSRAYEVIDQFERANILSVSITGGEPFVRSDIFDIMIRLLSKKINITDIYTNGLLVTEKVLGKIKSLGILPGFCVSFDGVGHHDSMRGTSGIEKDTIKAIKRIRSEGFSVSVATSIDRNNEDALIETYDLLKDMDIRSWQVAPPNSTGNWSGSDTVITLEEEADTYKEVLRKWHKEGRLFNLQLGAFFNSKADESGTQEQDKKARFNKEQYACGVCSQTLYLLPDGTLLPCHGLTGTILQSKMPNLMDSELSHIIKKSELMDFVHTTKGELLDHNPECAECELFEDCGMGCRASALITTGEINSKDPLSCRIHSKNYKKTLLGAIDVDKFADDSINFA